MPGCEKFYIEVLTECGYERVGEAFIDLNEACLDMGQAVQEGLTNLRLTDQQGRLRAYADDKGAYLVDLDSGEQVVGF